jgi:hypothetical protein
MAHNRKKNKKKRQQIDPYDILAGRVIVTIHELVHLIHRLNPTNEQISQKEKTERYQLKSRLQSLLIRRFSEELEVEQSDPDNNPQLVEFKLRYSGEDACHALLSELDEDVRSWTQRIIDEAKTTTTGQSARPLPQNQQFQKIYEEISPLEYKKKNSTEEGINHLTEDELIRLGKRSMDKYDYISSKEYLQHALFLSHGSVEAAKPLLELFVDHLAAYGKALEIAELLSETAIKDKGVRTLLALAAAHSGQIERAFEYIHKISLPRVAEVYLIGARYFVRQGDVDRATELLTSLKCVEHTQLMFEIDQLQQDLYTLQTKNLEPLEKKMMRSWQAGRLEEASKLANELLAQWPENKAARKIRNTIEQQKRDDKFKMLLSQADEANKNEEYKLEAGLIAQALSLGASDHGLTERIKQSQIKAQQKREQAEIDSIERLWINGERRKALLGFTGLDQRQQEIIVARIPDPHFKWIEQIISSKGTVKPDKMVQAVLILERCEKALSKGDDPQHIVTELKKHSKALQSVSKANEILERAERMVKDLDYERSKTLLMDAGHFLSMGNLEKARGCLESVKFRLLHENDQKVFHSIHDRMQHLEKIVTLKRQYEVSVNNADHLTARNTATQLAAIHTNDKELQYWQSKIREHTNLLNKKWCFVTANVGDLPGCYGNVGIKSFIEELPCCIHQDGRHLIIASCHERWVFLRAFCLDDQLFKKIVIFRTPRNLGSLTMETTNDSIWLVGQDGNVLELRMDGFTIQSWYDFHDYANQAEIIESSSFFPKSRCLWLEKRTLGSEYKNLFEYNLIDIDQSRVIRRLAPEGFPVKIRKKEGYTIAIQKFNKKSIHLYSERGKLIDHILLESEGDINAAALHPNGLDLVFLPFDNSDLLDFLQEPNGPEPGQESDYLLTIEVKPDVEKKTKPIKIIDSDGESRHDIATSHDLGLIFILYGTNSPEGDTYRLAGFKPAERGFERLYQVDIDEECLFALAASSREIVLVNPLDIKFQAVRLDTSPPQLILDNDKAIKWNRLPHFAPPWMCHHPTGEINAKRLAFLGQLKDSSPGDISWSIQKMQQNPLCDPEEVSAFIYALTLKGYRKEVEGLRRWLRERHPGHIRVLIDLACDLADQQKWDEVIDLLEEVPCNQIDEGTGRHVCHILGIGYYINHNIEKALQIWEEGLSYEEGICKLDEYIEYAQLSKTPLMERRDQEIESDIKRVLEVYEIADHYCKNKDWDAVIETLEGVNALRSNDIQIKARLAEAYLHQNPIRPEKRWFFKIVVLADYCDAFDETHFRRNQALPPHIERWAESYLADTAARAKEWLEHETAL